MVTSPEEPQTIIPQLRFKGSRLQGMLYGYYRFEDDVVNYVNVLLLVDELTNFACEQ